LGNHAVPVRIFVSAALDFLELMNRFLLTGSGKIEPRGVSVGLFIFSVLIEARIAVASSPCGFGIDLVQISKDLRAGSIETVKVEPVEPGLRRMLRARVIVPAEPLYECFDIAIPPHPNRETCKSGERPGGRSIVATTANVFVDAMGIGPVCFDCNPLEALLSDQALRDRGPRGIELVGPVGSFAEEHKLCVRRKIDQSVKIGAAALQAMQRHSKKLDG